MTDAGEPERRSTPRRQYLAYGLAILLVIGGCVGVRLLIGPDREGRTATRDGSGTTWVARGDGTLTPVQYSDVLAEADSAIGTDFRLLDTEDPLTLATVAPRTAQTLYLQVGRLRAVPVPTAATAIHAQLLTELAGLGDMVQRLGTDNAEASCPAAQTPYGALLLSKWATGIRAAAQALARVDRSYVFGKFLPPAPVVPVIRPASGAFLTPPARRGTGELRIRNGSADTVVSLVPVGAATPLFTVYVRGHRDYTVRGVAAGTYRIYYATGADWNPSRKGFLKDCAFSRFDDTFRFRAAPAVSTWEITLAPVAHGNSSTSDVDPDVFPAS